MEFNKSNREALITNLRESNESLRIKLKYINKWKNNIVQLMFYGN